MVKLSLKEELFDSYVDIINIIENKNINKDYKLSAYKNAVKRCKELQKDIDKNYRKKKYKNEIVCGHCQKIMSKEEIAIGISECCDSEIFKRKDLNKLNP